MWGRQSCPCSSFVLPLSPTQWERGLAHKGRFFISLRVLGFFCRQG